MRGKISAHLDGVRAEGIECADPRARTSIGVSENLNFVLKNAAVGGNNLNVPCFYSSLVKKIS